MGGFLGATVLIINILEVPRLGAGTVSAVLVSSLVTFVSPLDPSISLHIPPYPSSRFSLQGHGCARPGTWFGRSPHLNPIVHIQDLDSISRIPFSNVFV